MQAVIVKYLPPTAHRGSRIKASCSSGSITVPFDYAAHDPYLVAARALLNKLDWSGYDLVQGTLPNGDQVFIPCVRS